MTFPRPFALMAFLLPVFLLTACPDNDDDENESSSTAGSSISLQVIGSYQSNIFDDGAAEIVAYDADGQQLFVVNSADTVIDVIDISDPAMPQRTTTIDASAEGAGANSVAVYGDILAVAIEADAVDASGKVVFYSLDDLSKTAEVTVGVLPDMLTFTPDGSKVLVANEGEPSDDYTVDPEGTVSIIDISGGVASATVSTADFTAFNSQADALRTEGVRIFGPGASVAQDLEPEYIALSADGNTAWVSLQENNAIAVVDIDTATVTDIRALGFKDHSVEGNELDASNRDEDINIRNWPVLGMYQPDAIASYSSGGQDYYVTANEGDARDYDGFSEEFRVEDLQLDATAFPDTGLQDEESLGRLRVTSTLGVSNGCDPSNVTTDVEADCVYDTLYSYGARSFSIWNAAGELVFDSGSQFERIVAEVEPDFFNSSNDENAFDDRSDDKGPEPEGVAIGTINDKTYAFVGLERVGGIMVFDITEPSAAEFVQYINNRDFTVSNEQIDDGTVGDLGPEGLAFISAEDSPNEESLLAVGNEVSGTTTLYQITLTD